MIAHRGASGDAPENTLAAFHLAVEQGADGIELDVRLTRDGVPVVIHDRTIDRTTSGSGKVGTLTLAEVKRLDAGSWFSPAHKGEQIPTLDEVFNVLPKGFLINVEMKVRGPGTVRLATSVSTTIQRHARTETTLIASFNPAALWVARRTAPEIARGFIWSRHHPLPFRQRWFQWLAGPTWMNPAQETCPPSMLQQLHNQGFPVLAWSTDFPKGTDGRQQWDGVDAVVTNFPGDVLAQRI